MTTQNEKGPVTFAMCGQPCDHDFFAPGSSERAFDDGHGSERVCAKCGMGALQADILNKETGGDRG